METFAEGLATRVAVRAAAADPVASCLDDFVLVSDDEIRAASS